MRARVMIAAAAAAATVAGWTIFGPGEHSAVRADPAPVVSANVNGLLNQLVVVDELPQVPGYERACGIDKKTQTRQGCVFGAAWNDPQDHSGCDTRNRLLHNSLQGIGYKPGTRDCKVIAGRLDPDPYTGQVLDLKQVAIDHIVPLKVAWNSGAAQWDLQQRRIFANDMTELIAVSSAANSSKGDSTPSKWLPAIGKCPYVIRYLTVAVKYRLPVTVKDRDAAVRACHTN
ncbi:protein of uncharacterised function (DUF1994) [Mycobacteroides abscessus subsp. abscessus]|uniref:HNH endonuclease family protein n=1 Tax=Mycobacteroides abscessus TaxID=36809 RepID=UPI00092C9B1F|nr:HNH endonuclease family protein [Mycobacteroides abscessus]SIJ20502.1 protein of uncharacterised function (DUF1994) [Mycobacteroides abscessus subsp. abscessus]SLH39740.1 protein of uncharacterised function (DUF1994) [Mycobacteroides abscessus subsp. abscessus]